MRDWIRAAIGATQLELVRIGRSRLVVALAFLQSVTFVVLVSLFGLTGNRAPTALVDLDRGPYGVVLTRCLEADYQSFDLRAMTAASAQTQLSQGRLVAMVTIPKDFSNSVNAGRTVALPVVVDNVNVDLTDDVQRALPAAIVSFAKSLQLPEVRVVMTEQDLVSRDTQYVPYLVVSALALDAFVLGGILAGVSVAREYEELTIKLWRVGPASPGAMLIAKVVVASLVSSIALLVTAAVVILGYGVRPKEPVAAAAVLVVCAVTSSGFGAWLGRALQHSTAVAPLFFGLAIPLFMDSGALEPERFDGNAIWALAHLSPVYYGVGLLQEAFHGIQVTPEPIWLDAAILVLIACLLLAAPIVVGARRRT